MKNVFVASLVLALLASAAVTVSASEPAAVSGATLSSMGLGGMQQMSDSDGLAIRGKGTFAGVWGGSTAAWSGGQLSTNSYEAGASWNGKPAFAKGDSLSFAGHVEALYGSDPTGSVLSVQVIGGISGGRASAKAF